ncbi:restriction endonuclease subunit S [Streptococcus periodonticum]
MRYKNLSDFSIGKGTYGISASAVGKDDNLPTYLRITDINDDGTINFASLKSVDRSDADKYRLQPNDIVFARTGGSTGRSYFYDGKDGEFVFAGFLIKFSIDPQKCIPKFIKYYCQSREYYNWVASFNTGSTRGNINAKTFEKMPIPDLPLEQQQLIVDVLSPIDDKIENNKKINHHLEQIGQELFEEIYYDGSSAQLGDIISTLESGSRPKGGAETDGIPSIGAENIERFGQYDYTKEKFISLEYFQKLKRGIVHSGDVLLYKDGAYTGKVSMALDDFPHAQCAINEHIFILRPNELAPSSFFLYFLLLHDKNKQALFSRASSKAAQPGLNQTEVKTLPILLPKTEMITKLESTIAPVMHQIAKNANENRKLITLQKALLPKLLSGEISVN